MSTSSTWLPTEPDLATALSHYPDPLLALSKADMPAIVLRGAYNMTHGDQLIDRFLEKGLMRDPHDTETDDKRTRIDIGTSLGNMGHDKEAFLSHAVTTHALFEHLFDGFDNPVDTIYDALQTLAVGKTVKVAHEPDGQMYGPAIFRIHYTHHSYKPHIDHVTLREKRFNYAVTRFEHQFAGVLVLRNAVYEGFSPQGILHQCLWAPEIQPHIAENTFHQYAAENGIGNCQVNLEAGDLYFFNTRCIHEVRAVQGNNPRIVLAVFIGYSPDDPEVFVWS
ncbi:MAG: hypothetical protein AAF629_16055 [Chloroflexota bacterium]